MTRPSPAACLDALIFLCKEEGDGDVRPSWQYSVLNSAGGQAQYGVVLSFDESTDNDRDSWVGGKVTVRDVTDIYGEVEEAEAQSLAQVVEALILVAKSSNGDSDTCWWAPVWERWLKVINEPAFSDVPEGDDILGRMEKHLEVIAAIARRKDTYPKTAPDWLPGETR